MEKLLIKLIGNSINFLGVLFPAYAAKIAVKLFSTPRKGKLTQEQNNYLKSAKQNTLNYNNINIKTYHWKGTNDTVLLVHGWESNSARWEDLINLLQNKNHNIIALDAPAHGASGNKTFNAILYSKCINLVLEKYKPSVVIGHSIGGTASALAVNDFYHPVKKLILLGAPSNFDKVIDQYVKIMGYTTKIAKAIDEYYHKNFGYYPKFYNIENFTKNIKAKGLIIHDKKDRIISYADALHIYKYYPNSKLIKTMGLGHRLKSKKVYEYILEFLNE